MTKIGYGYLREENLSLPMRKILRKRSIHKSVVIAIVIGCYINTSNTAYLGFFPRTNIQLMLNIKRTSHWLIVSVTDFTYSVLIVLRFLGTSSHVI